MSYLLNDIAYCIEYFYVKPGYRDKLIEALLTLVESTLVEVGCLQYDLLLDNKNPDLIIMLVKFTNKKTMADHEQSKHVQHFSEHAMKQYCEKLV